MKTQGRNLFITIVCIDLLIVLAIFVIRFVNSRGPNSPAVDNTSVPESAPGVIIYGSVRYFAGAGVGKVPIYARIANSADMTIATSDANGNYQSDFIAVPGDAVLNAWAESPGLVFQPQSCIWHHYLGYEMKLCNFYARPLEVIYLPIMTKALK